MTLTQPGYRPRLVDKEIDAYLRTMGAVCIEGPKWCGKTWAAMNHASSYVDLSDSGNDFQNRKLAELDPSLVMDGDVPHLIDEWQVVPKIWDTVRSVVDKGHEKGRYILTGSSTPVRKGILHSGTGRIATIRMHTMSLYESGDSTGAVSLAGLFNGDSRNVHNEDVSLRHLAYLVVRGGWPDSIGVSADDAPVISRQYLESIRDEDFFKIDGKHRDSGKVRMLIRSLARNEATVVSNNRLIQDMKEFEDGTVDPGTLADYLGVLRRMFLIEDQMSFNPGLRSSYRVGKSPKRHLADPSLSAAAIGATTDGLMKDLNTLGFLFEAMCERDLRVYSQSMRGTIGHYRDGRGNEIDAAVQMQDGRWGAFEVRLGMNQVDSAAEKLIGFREKIADDNGRQPEFLCVLVGMSSYAYRREDGVYVVPITALRDRWREHVCASAAGPRSPVPSSASDDRRRIHQETRWMILSANTQL